MESLGSWLIPALYNMVQSRIGRWIAGALTWFGLVVSSNEILVQPLIDRMMTAYSMMPSEVTQWVQFLHLPEAANMVLSAYAARLAMTGIRAYLVRKVVGG